MHVCNARTVAYPEGVPPRASRRRAVLAHLSVALLGIGVLYPIWLKHRGDAFEAHHGGLAAVLTGLLALLEAVHVLLHFAVAGLTGWLQRTAGDLGVPLAPWTLDLLHLVGRINSGVILAEVAAACALACWMARRAWRGETPRWFFIPVPTPKPWDPDPA